MSSDDASPSLRLSAVGTPADYTEGLYRLYFEISDADGTAERIIRDFLGAERARQMCRLTHGFEFELPIQCVLDLVRLLVNRNIGICQVVRYARVDGRWS